MFNLISMFSSFHSTFLVCQYAPTTLTTLIMMTLIMMTMHRRMVVLIVAMIMKIKPVSKLTAAHLTWVSSEEGFQQSVQLFLFQWKSLLLVFIILLIKSTHCSALMLTVVVQHATGGCQDQDQDQDQGQDQDQDQDLEQLNLLFSATELSLWLVVQIDCRYMEGWQYCGKNSGWYTICVNFVVLW